VPPVLRRETSYEPLPKQQTPVNLPVWPFLESRNLTYKTYHKEAGDCGDSGSWLVSSLLGLKLADQMTQTFFFRKRERSRLTAGRANDYIGLFRYHHFGKV